jgi:DnaJ-class molecular chaperone
MRERITYWKCSHCHGTGRTIWGHGDTARAETCFYCDGTGNAFVDGATECHKRRLEEIDTRDRGDRK